jgi:pilus assembly protein CpaC
MSRLTLKTLACAVALVLATPSLAPAQTMESEFAPNRVITVPRDKSLSFRLDRPATKIVVAQPNVAEIVATTERSFYVRGVEFGSTNLLVYGPNSDLQQVIDIRVGYDAQSLQQDLAAALPGESIQVRTLGEGLLLTGNVSTSRVAAKAKLIADKYAPEAVTSIITAAAAQQVVLEVRVLEASRSAMQDIGFLFEAGNNSFAIGTGTGLISGAPPAGALVLTGGVGNTYIDVAVQALEEKGLVRTLARPNLVAVSGEKASFLAGGEFPFPVPQGQDQVTIEFRPYGVKLNFLPTVQDNGLIRMAVEPEVSQLDNSNSLRIGGVTIPSLTVRRAATTVELKAGESFAVAGLFQRDYTNNLRQVPFAGDIPVLGALFRSARWKRNETELVIIVTPRMATNADIIRTPPDVLAGKAPSTTDLFLMGKSLDKPLVEPAQPQTPEAPAAALEAPTPVAQAPAPQQLAGVF